jgi:penicillin-binding protein 2
LLQLAQATATLANNGLYRPPHLVHATVDARTGVITPQIVKPDHQIPLKQENLNIVKDAMADVVRLGTARKAFVGATYQAAGKTGTAQVYSLHGHYRFNKVDERLRDHALFMGFAPVDHPRIAVALILENAGWGASEAAPVARKVFDYWMAKGQDTPPAAGSAEAAVDQVLGHVAVGLAGEDALSGLPNHPVDDHASNDEPAPMPVDEPVSTPVDELAPTPVDGPAPVPAQTPVVSAIQPPQPARPPARLAQQFSSDRP